MNKTLLWLLLISLFSLQKVNAQIEQILYKSFSIPDSTDAFDLQVIDPFEIQTWNGANVMVETTVRFSGAPIELLQAVIKDGRYAMQIENHFPTTLFKNSQRWVLKNNTSGKDVVEVVTHRFYIPEEFKVVSGTHISRREDITADARKKVESVFQSAVKFDDYKNISNGKTEIVKQ